MKYEEPQFSSCFPFFYSKKNPLQTGQVVKRVSPQLIDWSTYGKRMLSVRCKPSYLVVVSIPIVVPLQTPRRPLPHWTCKPEDQKSGLALPGCWTEEGHLLIERRRVGQLAYLTIFHLKWELFLFLVAIAGAGSVLSSSRFRGWLQVRIYYGTKRPDYESVRKGYGGRVMLLTGVMGSFVVCQ